MSVKDAIIRIEVSNFVSVSDLNTRTRVALRKHGIVCAQLPSGSLVYTSVDYANRMNWKVLP